MKPEAGVTLDVGRHLCLAHHLHYQHHLLLLREHVVGEEQWPKGHDDRLQVGVEGNAGDAGPAHAPNHNTVAGHTYQPKIGGWQWVRVRRVR